MLQTFQTNREKRKEEEELLDAVRTAQRTATAGMGLPLEKATRSKKMRCLVPCPKFRSGAILAVGVCGLIIRPVILRVLCCRRLNQHTTIPLSCSERHPLVTHSRCRDTNRFITVYRQIAISGTLSPSYKSSLT